MYENKLFDDHLWEELIKIMIDNLTIEYEHHRICMKY